MANQTSVYIFGDQTDDVRGQLRALLRVVHDPILETFLKKSFARIRLELLRPYHVEDKSNSRFATLLELVEIDLTGPQKVALDHALTSICQFGLFLKHSHELDGRYPTDGSEYLVGLCTGALTCSAISYCRSVSELLPVAVEVVVLSFRAGEYAAERGACHFSGSQNSDSYWAILAAGLDVESAVTKIDTFVRCEGLPRASQPYVGSLSPQGVTICGPPHVLSRLCGHEAFSTTKSVPLPIYAPYHASHLYSSQSMESLLNLSSTIQWETYPHSIIDVSCHGNGITPKPNLRASLLAALNMIFRECMDWGKMVTDVTSRIQGSPSKIRVIPIASGGSQTLLRILKGNGIQLVELVKPVSDPMFNDEYNKTMYQTTSGCKIAIVGAACRFPSADNVHAFWDLLIQGRDVHKPVPPLRWSVDSHVDTSAKPMKNTSATPFGCWLDEPGLFDAGFFGMSPREAEQVDPAQRLALMTAYEALEDGGIVPGARSTQRDRVGVAFGVTSNDWMETNSAQNIDTYMIPGGNRAFIPGRINYAFKFSGPSYAIDTACSSSLAAIDIACKVLERGEVDTMIAGGSNIITNPDFTAGLDKGRFLSRTGNCKTFDDLADGYCRAEGVATVILKRLEDAILDGDSIKGVIVKACTNHSAEAESITRPYVQAQQQIFTKVLDGLSPAKISYVEMHGTGTQVGDATEMTSMLNVIAPNQGSQRRRPKEDVVHVGSVKANVGHGEAVAGVTSLIKLLMMMQHNTIPPHCGIKTVINRKFPTDLADRGVQIASRPTAWAKQDVRPRYALLNNFSAAGGNTTLLLEDGPTISLAASSMDSRLIFPITLSAKTPSALRANAESLLDFTLRKPDTDLQSLSYTTTARRMHHAYRIAICGSSLNEIASNLRSYLEIQTGKQRPIKHSVLFTFTGQGGHYMGMGRTLYHTNTFFKKTMDRYCDLASNQGFCDFLPLIKNLEGDISDFGADATQLAITCVQMALSKLWQSWGVVPSGVMGHSLGHYAALNTAGVLSEADTIFAVGIRAQLLHENCRPGTHSMLVVRANEREVQPFLDNYDVEVACVNSPLEVVLSGERTKIETCREALSMSRIRSMVLGIPYAFHSSQVDCVLKDFEVALRGVNFKAPRIPVICPRMRAVVRKERLFNPAHLVEHFRSSVNIVDAIEVAKRENFIGAHTQFLEIGHNANISAMLKANLGNCCNVYASIKKDMDNWASLTEAIKSLYMSGLDIRWDEFHRDYSSHLHVVELPSYNWDLKNYWIPYVNDWSLRKGEPAQIIESGTRPKLLSRTIHSVVREEVFNSQGTIVLRTDLSTPKLRVVAQGHKVKGLALCTPSLYADIALSVGRYIQSTHLGALFSKQISVDDMVVEKALIALHTTPQLLQTLVHINEDQKVRCEFSTVQEDGTILTRHASCVVIYGSNPTSEILRDQAVQINTAIQRMQEELMAGISYRFNSSMIYRMVATLADFDRGYRGLKEIILNSEAMTATGIVDLSILPKDAHSQPFTAHPAYVDSFSQLAGFVMNANEACDLEVECFVNHGWGSLVLYDDINEKGVYQVYVEMKKRENRIWQGTLVVLRDERVVAIFKDITLQGIPPRLLHQVLSSASKTQSRENQGLNDRPAPSYQDGVAAKKPSPMRIEEKNAKLESDSAKILAIISEESGIDSADLLDDMQLVDLGIDSLLSLLITSRLRDDLQFDLGPITSLFDEFKTLKQLKMAYAQSQGLTIDEEVPLSSEAKDAYQMETRESETVINSLSANKDNISQSVLGGDNHYGLGVGIARPITSIVLQQCSSPDSKILFLFPDGSGSATSYTRLPPVSDHITIIALTCPYRRDPHNMTCSLECLISSYISEIKRRQPTGAYALGGWSSGGIFAFCAAQMLLDAGETVQDLLLLDSPALQIGRGLDRLPKRFFEHCQQVGVFGQVGATDCNGRNGSQSPDWLIPHFEATIELLAGYRAQPLKLPKGAVVPRISLCWASECALDGSKYATFKINDEDDEGVRFLAEKRTDYGAGSWATMFPGLHCHVEVLQGWNHFNMMYGDGAESLGKFIEKALLGAKGIR